MGKFEHDTINDVVWASFDNLQIKLPEDAERWYQETQRALARYGRKIDLIIDLNGLHVGGRAARVFGERRAEILRTYARYSIRFGGDQTTKALIFTSAVIDSTQGDLVPTREEALKLLLEKRKKDSR